MITIQKSDFLLVLLSDDSELNRLLLILNEANQPVKMENNIVAAHIIKQDIFSHTNTDCW